MEKSKVKKPQPRLYGLNHINKPWDQMWGKNRFNSAFPASLACYMRDTGTTAVYLRLNKAGTVVATEIPWDEVFNTTAKTCELTFCFETKYDPYQQYSDGDIGGIDLVIKHGDDWLRPLEIKLTVLPDSCTAKLAESGWGSEIVIRPASTLYAALGIWDACRASASDIRRIFGTTCRRIKHWDSVIEIRDQKTNILLALDKFMKTFWPKQKPFLLQPIWKTQGQSPILADNAFDIFVWSDFALCSAFIKKSSDEADTQNEVSRYMRSSAQLARCLHELSASGMADTDDIYNHMPLGNQNDKGFALNGRTTNPYMKGSKRLQKPALPKEVVTSIILGGGEDRLKPERRFDQTLYFTAKPLFQQQNAAFKK